METHILTQNHSPYYGLSRFRSSPTSLLANFTDDDECGADKATPREGSESERLISRFMNQVSNPGSDTSTGLREFEDKSQMSGDTRAAAADPNRVNSQLGQSGLPPYYPRQSSGYTGSSTVDTSYGLLGSSLSRQNSSPAGFFSRISAPNDYSAIRSMGSYGGINGSEGDRNQPRNRLKSQLRFSSNLPDISEIGEEASPGADKSWIESPFGENFDVIKRDYQKEKLRNTVRLLPHQLSVPQTSSEVLAIEQFLRFQDSVPCRTRAKRGCATHPRSIAERVRRTRISERMRKLQELVPNMDKQTNTADMLDLAVDYIKDLQNQFKALSTNRANCKCVIMKKHVSD